ncbi:MAG: FixH family protein [Candidatus Manganitrophaceae bacterium]
MLKSRIWLGIGIVKLSLNGCMIGMHGPDSDPTRHMGRLTKTFVKEGVSVALEIPGRRMNAISVLTVKINETATGKPISGAKVLGSIERVDGVSSAPTEPEASETSEKGIYKLDYAFETSGLYEFTIKAWVGEDRSGPPMTLSATEEIYSQGGAMMNSSTAPWVILGGIGMALTMILKKGN